MDFPSQIHNETSNIRHVIKKKGKKEGRGEEKEAAVIKYAFKLSQTCVSNVIFGTLNRTKPCRSHQPEESFKGLPNFHGTVINDPRRLREASKAQKLSSKLKITNGGIKLIFPLTFLRHKKTRPDVP